MSSICVGSVRSCGVTTLAAGLARAWPGEGRRVLFEADPSGGTLAASAGLAPEPGLVSLAAAARRRHDPGLTFEHAQDLFGMSVVGAPPGSGRARAALTVTGHLLGHLSSCDATFFFDCGRLDAGDLDRFGCGDVSLLVVRPRLADLSAIAAFVEEHPTVVNEATQLVLVGDGPYPAREVAEALDLYVAGAVPWDVEAAAALVAMRPESRRLSRSPLTRALRSLAERLARRLPVRPPPVPPANHVANGDSSVPS